MKTSDIKKMSVTERVRAMELLWDSFSYEDIEVVSPAWHGEILSQRKERIVNGKASFTSLDELKRNR